MPDPGREGGCLCGAIRYQVRGEPLMVALCHCAMCRRAAGAPAVAWAMFTLTELRFLRAEPARYVSSPGVERGFCGRCGTTLTFTGAMIPGLVDVTLGSLDDPADLPPQMHIWEQSRVPWLALADDLPRHAELPPQA